jgi:hypothetical protein
MANDPMQQVVGFMPEMQDITRQREMAKLLMQQGQAPLQGQMIGNKYVAPSPWEGIANLFSTYKANKLAKEADTKQAELAELIRKGTAADMLRFNELRYGSQGTADVVPQGQTLRDDEGSLTYGAQQGVAPIAANPAEAYKFALQSRFPQVSGQAYEMLKPQKLGPEESMVVFNPVTGKQEVVMQGKDKFHEPMKIDTGTGTLLLDPTTRKELGFIPKAKGGPESLAATGPLRTSFIGEAKPHVEIANAYSKVISAPSSAAGDISKIFGYMKILDPGSTVREGEFATAQNATGVPGKIANLYNKVISGERLSPAQRAEFDQAAGALVQSQKQQYKGIEEHYTNIAKDAGINPSHIVRDPYAGLDIKVPKAPVVTPVQTQGTGRYNPLRTPSGASQALGLPSQNDIDAELARRNNNGR